jgi:integrase
MIASGKPGSTASAREGLSGSRIANHFAVARAIFGWASRPTRRLIERNPLVGIELPPNDEKPRTRVADAEEAAALLAALSPPDAVPYALAFYAGLRRAEIQRLDWPEVEVELDGYRLMVRRSKSAGGTGRRPPIAEPPRPILLGEHMRQGRGAPGPSSAVSVMSGKLADRARHSWAAAGLEPITLHECRHTYASFLMAAGYTLRELMEYMGHSSLQARTKRCRLFAKWSTSSAAPSRRRSSALV